MNKRVLFSGAACMAILGTFLPDAVSAQAAVGLGLMWIGFATPQTSS